MRLTSSLACLRWRGWWKPGCSQEVLKVALNSMSSLVSILTYMSSPRLHSSLWTRINRTPWSCCTKRKNLPAFPLDENVADFHACISALYFIQEHGNTLICKLSAHNIVYSNLSELLFDYCSIITIIENKYSNLSCCLPWSKLF